MDTEASAAPDVDVAIVAPAPEPEPDTAAEEVAEAIAEAQTDAVEQSEISVLTARVIQQSEQLGRIEGLIAGIEGRFAPASNEYVTRTELDAKLAATVAEPVEDDAIVLEPPEPEPVPEEADGHGHEEHPPAASGPPRIKVKW